MVRNCACKHMHTHIFEYILTFQYSLPQESRSEAQMEGLQVCS